MPSNCHSYERWGVLFAPQPNAFGEREAAKAVPPPKLGFKAFADGAAAPVFLLLSLMCPGSATGTTAVVKPRR